MTIVYFRKLRDGLFIYLLLYVDDMLIASKSQNEIEKLKTQLNQEFEMKDLGEAKKCLNHGQKFPSFSECRFGVSSDKGIRIADKGIRITLPCFSFLHFLELRFESYP